MMSSPKWKNELGFAERLDVINKIAACLETTDGSLDRSSWISRAQKEEAAFYEQARSKDEYIQLYSSRLSKARAPQDVAPTAKEPEMTPPGGPKVCIGPYENAAQCGSGLFSTIYCSTPLREQTSRQLVALKVTSPRDAAPPHDPVREARILRVASSHPNILQFVDSFHLPTSEFVLVIQFLPASLDDLLSKKQLSAKRTRELLADILSGLHHLHLHKILHRDIKPSNILLPSVSGSAVIADFGIAWSGDDPASEPADQKIPDIGTTCYRAPELLFGYRGYGEGVDIWAAGCVLAECLHSDHKPLFDAGDLGSELRLIASIFQTLGTPTAETWPETAKFPDFGKVSFFEFKKQPWRDIVPSVENVALDLLSRMIVYESSERIRAGEALRHAYFQGITNHPGTTL